MSRKKKERIDTGQAEEPLSHNPFAALGGVDKDSLPQKEQPEPPGTQDEPAAPYSVGRTRKGGFALSIEKRSGGKVVTVVGNVSGDAKALLKALRKHCATGGVVRGEAIELQGDHREKIEAFLKTV